MSEPAPPAGDEQHAADPPAADQVGDPDGCAQRVHLGHMHVHDVDCGHSAVVHGSHLDYLHDDHRHAGHGTHYDEH